MDAPPNGSLLSFLAEVPDPRSRRGRRHPVSAILALVCCAIMCGAKSYAAIAQWGEDQDIVAMHRLGFTRKPPKIGGIRKVLIALNLKFLEDALTRWAETLLNRPIQTELSLPEAFALDGKSARGSFDGLEKAVHLLSLMAHESGLTVAQTAVPNGGRTRPTSTRQPFGCLKGSFSKGDWSPATPCSASVIFPSRSLTRKATTFGL
jgi:hypothetical protein